MEENFDKQNQEQSDSNMGNSNMQPQGQENGFRPISADDSRVVKKGKGTWLGILIIIILVVLIMVLPSDKEEGEELSVTTGEETVGQQPAGPNIKVVDPSEPGAVSDASGVSFTTNGHTYGFKDIDWLFEGQGQNDVGQDLVMVRLQFIGFTRDGVDITVLPYRLGVHPGECSEVEVPANANELVPAGKALKFLQCADGNNVRQIGVYQNGSLVESYLRYRLQGKEFTEMNKIQTIDLVEVVQ